MYISQPGFKCTDKTISLYQSSCRKFMSYSGLSKRMCTFPRALSFNHETLSFRFRTASSNTNYLSSTLSPGVTVRSDILSTNLSDSPHPRLEDWKVHGEGMTFIICGLSCLTCCTMPYKQHQNCPLCRPPPLPERCMHACDR